MGEKYSPEKLAAMRSIGFVSRGRTRHTSAGTVQESVTETRTENDFTRVTEDHNGATITEHRDGSQDVNVRPEPIHGKVAGK